jgi:hypothetical protein
MRGINHFLMKAHELIDSPEKWTQLAQARNAHGAEVSYWDRNAVCWCALGAILKAYPGNCYGDLERILAAYREPDGPAAMAINRFDLVFKRLTKALGQKMTVNDWNDSSDWQTVHDMLVKLDI